MAKQETFLDLVEQEHHRAVAAHNSMNSAHEAYAVILEELCEFWEEVLKKREERDKNHMLQELVQIAAMAMRAAYDLCLWRDRSIPDALPPWKMGVGA